ncbi:hypothetical protein [Edwardsiella ictaluri]|uniref:hypothetical protein n=1 Tax=Edwardsiella ictaluri TaxID=67780 RepID=UPI001E5F859F|nr:hypothetical protein [Edwardsiella ictaluri]
MGLDDQRRPPITAGYSLSTSLGWGERQVRRAMRYYRTSIWLIAPLLMAVVIFNNLANRSFTSTLGCACFIMMCPTLLLLATSLRRAGTPLYLNRADSGENQLNHLLWGGLLYALLTEYAGHKKPAPGAGLGGNR